MRVDFYQLSRDPAEAVLPQIAARCLGHGERLLIVSADAAQRERISVALWAASAAGKGEAFLAHGTAGGSHDARQPILLAERLEAAHDSANDIAMVAFADGAWREGAEAGPFARIFLLFDAAQLDGARACWRLLGNHEAVERRFWKRDGGRWVEGP